MWSAGQNIGQAGKGVFNIPGHVLDKNTWTLYRFFPSSGVNRKYIHTVTRTVVFVGPAGRHFVVNASPGRNATWPLSSCSNKNDGHAVALTVFVPLLVKEPFG